MGRAFWALVAGRFVNALGDGFFFPFAALFLTRVHGLPPAQVGLVMSAAGLCSITGRLPSGALTDRFGFKPVVVASTAAAGLAVIAAGFASSAGGFALAYAFLSFLVWAAFPAFSHGVALLAPVWRREEAFSIMNLLQNAAIAIGPMVGAWVVSRDFRLLFVADGLSFLLCALIVGIVVPGRPSGGGGRTGAAAAAAGRTGWDGPEGPRGRGRLLEGLTQAFWLPPASERAFWRVALGSALASVFYSQMGSTLPVDIEARFGQVGWYSLLWTLNGGMIALLQLPLTRWTGRYARRRRMAVASLLYGAAGLIFLVARPAWSYFAAFAVLTVGEMLFIPLAPAEYASMAPEGLGGRYQAAGSVASGAGWALGPVVGGLLLDHLGHAALWWTMVITALLAGWIVRPAPEGGARRIPGRVAS